MLDESEAEIVEEEFNDQNEEIEDDENEEQEEEVFF